MQRVIEESSQKEGPPQLPGSAAAHGFALGQGPGAAEGHAALQDTQHCGEHPSHPVPPAGARLASHQSPALCPQLPSQTNLPEEAVIKTTGLLTWCEPISTKHFPRSHELSLTAPLQHQSQRAVTPRRPPCSMGRGYRLWGTLPAQPPQ